MAKHPEASRRSNLKQEGRKPSLINLDDGWGPVGPPEGPGFPTDPPGWGEFPPDWPAPDDPVVEEPGGEGPDVPDPGYEVEISPQTRVILPGRTAVYTISILPAANFARVPLAFAILPWTNFPTGQTTFSFNVNPIRSVQGRGPFRTTLAIQTWVTVPIGAFGFNLSIAQAGIFGRYVVDNRVPEGRLMIVRLRRPSLRAPIVD